ncbi:MAG: DUF5683 domain-containing protein [Cyclobacteriaceae bacterium]|nr:DUF5683 domain-containing protein [Cyclobacteriaceae bacterium]
MKPYIFFLLFFVFLFSFHHGKGQNDTEIIKEEIALVIDTSDVKKTKSYSERFDPRKAGLYSAVFPGLGQIYNKKYWKAPLVYGGMVGFGMVIDYYNNYYNIFKTDLFRVLDDPTYENPNFPGYGETEFRSMVDKAQRQRDYYTILSIGFYLLQIVDAHVDAHLKEFDLNPDLQVKFEPSFEQIQLGGVSAGFGISIKF